MCEANASPSTDVRHPLTEGRCEATLTSRLPPFLVRPVHRSAGSPSGRRPPPGRTRSARARARPVLTIDPSFTSAPRRRYRHGRTTPAARDGRGRRCAGRRHGRADGRRTRSGGGAHHRADGAHRAPRPLPGGRRGHRGATPHGGAAARPARTRGRAAPGARHHPRPAGRNAADRGRTGPRAVSERPGTAGVTAAPAQRQPGARAARAARTRPGGEQPGRHSAGAGARRAADQQAGPRGAGSA